MHARFSRHMMFSACAVALGASSAWAAEGEQKKFFTVEIASTATKASAIRQMHCASADGKTWKAQHDTKPFPATTSDGTPVVVSFPDCETLVKKGAEISIKDLKTLPQADAAKLPFKVSVKVFDK